MDATTKVDAKPITVPCLRCKDYRPAERLTIVCDLCRGDGRIALDQARREIRLEASEIGELEREMGFRKRTLANWREVVKEAEFSRFRD